jgi:hypothetical protein
MQKDRMAYEIQMKNGNSKSKLLVDENGNIQPGSPKTFPMERDERDFHSPIFDTGTGQCFQRRHRLQPGKDF